MGLFKSKDKPLTVAGKKLLAEMKRELHMLIDLVESGRLNEADALWCSGCQKYHPRLRARR
jgi:hypothetical protein